MNRLLILILTILSTISYAQERYDFNKPTSQNILSQDDVDCLYGKATCSQNTKGPTTMNISMGRLINFDLFWDNYPGKDYSGEEVRKMIGGNLNAASSWLGRNTCAIRLSRGLNYSDNEIDRDNFRINASKMVNGEYKAGLVLSGADQKWYAVRVAEMTKYYIHNYGTPITLRKNMRVTKENVEGEENLLETEELEQRLKDLGAKGVIAFTVFLWNDATGHLEPWNGYHVAGHQRFKEAQSVSIWIMENIERCGGELCLENQTCIESICEDSSQSIPIEESELGKGNKPGCSMGVSSNTNFFLFFLLFIFIIKRKYKKII